MSDDNPDPNGIKPITNPLFDRKYFKVQRRVNDNLYCVCVECNATLNANVNVTSNLLKHVKVSSTV